jgi:hypothetical protein
LARRRSMVDEGGPARSGSVTTEVAETLQDLVMGSEEIDELGERSARYGEIGRSAAAEEMTEELLVVSEEEGEPLAKVPSHPS